MKLVHPEALAHDLEEGLARVDPISRMVPEHYRLRQQVGGLAAIAIRNALSVEGYKVALVSSHPRLGQAPNEGHIFPVVNGGDNKEHTIIDPTYSSLLRLAGVTPEGVMLSDSDTYPEEKIMMFTYRERNIPADALTMVALQALSSVKEPEPPLDDTRKRPPFWGMHGLHMRNQFAEFWNPNYFRLYAPTMEALLKAEFLHHYISRESLELTDD